MPSEADTCRKFVLPKLYAAGWNDDQIVEQRSFTDGRIVVSGPKVWRRAQKRADYLLRYRTNVTLAVVEAKPAHKTPGEGLQQAKEYAQILDLKFAYSTNGHGIVEFDFITGKETVADQFPTPEALWQRLHGHLGLNSAAQQEQYLAPGPASSGKLLRYYQEIAVNRIIRAILNGQTRVLITMATGTGKTMVAFYICWRLWASRWNRKHDPTRKPRILYLADRNFLVDDPKDKTFAAFGDARHKIEGGVTVLSRELYFATYQSIAKDERRPGLYKEFPRDFFDLIIVDECHRGSARDDSNWREILDYFEPAYKLGMTATPQREENKDTYLYFGNPVYTYSLKQGIDDGFLAPYRVHRVVTQWDAVGWRPSKAELDRYGREIPDEVYQTADFERRVALRARTEAVARHLTDFLKKTDRFAKTIVFCVDQEHALEMKTALNNLNADLVRNYPNYVCRVTSDEGDVGRGHMQKFQDVETDPQSPIILTTSQLLTTGLDAPTCRNVVLLRLVNSMVEFKQIIGRGTRVRDEYGKLWFNILDYTGSATRNFADPKFDGDPAFATQEEIDKQGKVKATEVLTPEEPEDATGEINETPSLQPSRKYYVDGGRVEIAADLVYELDAHGKQLRVVKLTDYTAENVRTLAANPEELRACWTDTERRAEIIAQLADRGIDFQTVATQAGKPEADPFDLLCHLAYNAPLLTRRQRADRVKKQETAFFKFFGPEAREILNDLLEKYATDGELQFTLPDVLKVRPISDHGNVNEIIGKFGGTEKLRNAVNQLQELIYSA
ncbi:MAG: DEAD/DEAH box helicase family protein [Verrucomicrobiota bacterium]